MEKECQGRTADCKKRAKHNKVCFAVYFRRVIGVYLYGFYAVGILEILCALRFKEQCQDILRLFQGACKIKRKSHSLMCEITFESEKTS